MTVAYKRAALSGANLMIFSGRVTGEELLDGFRAIDENREDSSYDWFTVDNQNADISDLTFDVLAKLKAILAPKMRVMKARRNFEVVIVCHRPLNEPIYLTWKSFVGDDETYPSNPTLFSDLQAACQHLNYEGAERREILDLCGEAHSTN